MYTIIDLVGLRYKLEYDGKTFPHLILFQDLQKVDAAELFKTRRRRRGRHRANLPEDISPLQALPDDLPLPPSYVKIPVVKAPPIEKRRTRPKVSFKLGDRRITKAFKRKIN